MNNPRQLRVFLCHASQDKPVVRNLYQRLKSETWIDPWLDEERLLPGQDWNLEIEKAVESSDAVIVCVSNTSVAKEGYVQKELRQVLNIALEKLEAVDISRTAFECGFSSHAHFTSVMRSKFGATPSQLRSGLAAGSR